jgi:hypothetical protein
VFCPVCGEDAGDDRRCPSCDADLSAFREASAGAASQTGDASGSTAAGGSRGGKAAAGRPALRRWLPWTIAALVVIAAVVVVIAGPGGGDDATTPVSQGGGDSSGSAAAEAPVADTSGTYDELIRRANSMYDDGAQLFQNGQADEAAKYFAAAAVVYDAAWTKQPGDPNVGTDWATSLFYSGDIAAAIEQVDKVLAENPTFQPGLYNRGNFLVHSARVLDDEGDSAAATKAREEAAAAFRAAIAVGAGSDVGKAAAERLKSLESEQ